VAQAFQACEKLPERVGFSPGGTSAAEAAAEKRSLIAGLKRCVTQNPSFSATGEVSMKSPMG